VRILSGGADVKEFNTPRMIAEPNLFTVDQRLRALLKPTIAAIRAPLGAASSWHWPATFAWPS